MTHFSGLLIALCFGVFILYTAIKAIRLRHSEKRRLQVRFWLFVALIVLVLVFRRWFAARYGSVVWPQTMTTDILADLATIGGLILFIQSHRALGRNWSLEVVIQEKHELIETGPYAYIRHPLYSGVLLMFLGMALYCGRKACLIVFVYCFFGIYFKSQMEERLLARTFPAYSEYKRRTKALIPFIW
jgi:protein-S-isoprenylcysteine O-methyltransferase Ste14